MVEVAEPFLPLDGEDEEFNNGAAAPHWHPSIASSGREIRRRRLGFQISSDSPAARSISDSEAGCLDEEVELTLDLFDRGSLRREGGAGGGTGANPFPDTADPFGFGVLDRVEEMDSDYLELGMGLELGLGLRFGVEKAQEDGAGGAVVDLEEEDGSDWDREGFFVGRRGMVLECSGGGGEPSRSWDGKGVRIAGLGLDSDSDEEVIAAAKSPRFHERDVPDRVADDLSLTLCWDCLLIEEERRDPNEDFEWEEVDGRVDEREVLSVAMDADGDRSIVLDDSNADLELDEAENEERVQTVEWEVLLAMNNLERNVPIEHEDAQSYLVEDHDDYVYASEYEVLFGQFPDHETSINGSPPAAKSIVERLPTIVLTQLNAADHNALCAVCKDEFSLEEKVKQLPCLHHYHEGCILPWLRIRNTCPVCRHGLPTDDPDYESWQAQRAGGGGVVQ